MFIKRRCWAVGAAVIVLILILFQNRQYGDTNVVFRFCHPGGVDGLSFLDKDVFLSAGGVGFGTCLQWKLDLSNKNHVRAYAGDRLAVSPDGSIIATAGRERILRLYDATKGVIKHEFHDLDPSIIIFSPKNNSKLAILGGPIFEGRRILVFDTESHKVQAKIAIGDNDAIAFSPDGNIAAIDANGVLCIWKSVDGVKLRELHLPVSRIRQLAFSPVGDYIACTDDKMIYILDVASSKIVSRLAPFEGSRLLDMAISHDGEYVAASVISNRCLTGRVFIHIWHLSTDQIVWTYRVRGAQTSARVIFSPDGSFFLSGNSDGEIMGWSLKKILSGANK